MGSYHTKTDMAVCLRDVEHRKRYSEPLGTCSANGLSKIGHPVGKECTLPWKPANCTEVADPIGQLVTNTGAKRLRRYTRREKRVTMFHPSRTSANNNIRGMLTF